MNQESTSEAIMSYEAVALLGKAMASVFRNSGDEEKAAKAEMMQNIGMSLTATEVRSTQKYWHVLRNIEDTDRIYPAEYEANVVGILWSTFIQFGTWFGNSPYLIYGKASRKNRLRQDDEDICALTNVVPCSVIIQAFNCCR